MENRIFTRPTVEDTLALFSDFESDNKEIISLSFDDFIAAVKDATKTVVIEKSASGPDRLKSALRDIKIGFYEVASDLNLYSADSILCLIIANDDFDIKEMDHLTEFFNSFSNDTNIVWGFSKKIAEGANEVIVRMLISYINAVD